MDLLPKKYKDDNGAKSYNLNKIFSRRLKKDVWHKNTYLLPNLRKNCSIKTKLRKIREKKLLCYTKKGIFSD